MGHAVGDLTCFHKLMKVGLIDVYDDYVLPFEMVSFQLIVELLNKLRTLD